MAEAIMVIATVFMALFSGLTWNVSRQIKKDGMSRDAEVHDLYIKLTAGIMASGRAAGDPPIAARLFVEHETALREAIEKAKRPLTSQSK